MGGFRDGSWSGESQLIWTGGRKGDAIDLQFTVPEKGTHELLAVFTKAADYGIFEMAIDGKTIGSAVDLFDTKVTTTGEVSFGNLRLTKGTHVLKATAVGRNERSTGNHRTGNYLFGLDYLRLEKK
jgi:hypothetical protein